MDSSIKRGDIYYADLSPVVGSEQGGVRPVLIVQNNVGNRYSPTVIAAAITTATVLFFMIVLLFFVIPLSRGHSTTRKRMVIVPYQKGAVKSKPSAVPDNLCISFYQSTDLRLRII